MEKYRAIPGTHFVGLIALIAVSLSIASVIGLAVKDTANTSKPTEPGIGAQLFLKDSPDRGVFTGLLLSPACHRIRGVFF